MVKLNKYLRELGIDENYWLFEEKSDPRYKEDEDGFVNAEFFNLDTTLSLVIYSYLRYFKDNCLVGCPGYMEMEEWEGILDKMIEAFRLQIVEEPSIANAKISKNRRKKINHGMRLFAKYFNHLWF